VFYVLCLNGAAYATVQLYSTGLGTETRQWQTYLISVTAHEGLIFSVQLDRSYAYGIIV